MCRSLKRVVSKELEHDWVARHFKAKEADLQSNSWRWDTWSGFGRPGSGWTRDGQDGWEYDQEGWTFDRVDDQPTTGEPTAPHSPPGLGDVENTREAVNMTSSLGDIPGVSALCQVTLLNIIE